MRPLSKRIAERVARHIARDDAFEASGLGRDDITWMRESIEPVIEKLVKNEEVLGTVEVFFRGQWVPVGDVDTYRAEKGWTFNVSEPIKQVRFVYK